MGSGGIAGGPTTATEKFFTGTSPLETLTSRPVTEQEQATFGVPLSQTIARDPILASLLIDFSGQTPTFSSDLVGSLLAPLQFTERFPLERIAEQLESGGAEFAETEFEDIPQLAQAQALVDALQGREGAFGREFLTPEEGQALDFISSQFAGEDPLSDFVSRLGFGPEGELLDSSAVEFIQNVIGDTLARQRPEIENALSLAGLGRSARVGQDIQARGGELANQLLVPFLSQLSQQRFQAPLLGGQFLSQLAGQTGQFGQLGEERGRQRFADLTGALTGLGDRFTALRQRQEDERARNFQNLLGLSQAGTLGFGSQLLGRALPGGQQVTGTTTGPLPRGLDLGLFGRFGAS